jgi:hypothetical protein
LSFQFRGAQRYRDGFSLEVDGTAQPIIAGIDFDLTRLGDQRANRLCRVPSRLKLDPFKVTLLGVIMTAAARPIESAESYMCFLKFGLVGFRVARCRPA